MISQSHQPLSFRSGAFVAPRVELDERPIAFFLDGRRIGEYVVQTARAHLDAGLQNKYGEVRLGVFAGRLRANEDFGLATGAPDFDIMQSGYTASVTFDQRKSTCSSATFRKLRVSSAGDLAPACATLQQ